MRKKIIFLSIVLMIGVGFFQYLRNSNPEINYERFNVVAPGVLRTPDESGKYYVKSSLIAQEGIGEKIISDIANDGWILTSP
jgi:hypothetical protein